MADGLIHIVQELQYKWEKHRKMVLIRGYTAFLVTFFRNNIDGESSSGILMSFFQLLICPQKSGPANWLLRLETKDYLLLGSIYLRYLLYCYFDYIQTEVKLTNRDKMKGSTKLRGKKMKKNK